MISYQQLHLSNNDQHVSNCLQAQFGLNLNQQSAYFNACMSSKYQNLTGFDLSEFNGVERLLLQDRKVSSFLFYHLNYSIEASQEWQGKKYEFANISQTFYKQFHFASPSCDS